MSFVTNTTSPFRSSTATGFGIPVTHFATTKVGAGVSAMATSTSILRFNLKFRSRTYGNKNNVDEIRKSRQVAAEALENLEAPTSKDASATWEKRREVAERIRRMLQNMDDGEISVSPYDTAWVALVEDIGGSGRPQFPTSLEWISDNQLSDGSWGDRKFVIYDRILNTLACVVALTAWKMHPHKCNQGLRFIRENIEKLESEDEEHMPVGFEVALPSLMDRATKLGIEIPNNSKIMKNIYAKRDLKLRNIPMDLLHKKPTSLLFSLEGMKGLDWDKLLKVRESDGSFLTSPSSTAYALHHTKDELCLQYLLRTVKRFNGGVPHAYPVELFERLWCIDRLQRLGISRYFQVEIEECIKYVYRYWTNKGLGWARNVSIQEIDNTSMGFRLLRLYGYDVSADAFKQFEKGGEFCCLSGETSHGVTEMYNLYRASQLMYTQEHILADAKNYSANFLHRKRLNNELIDKWIITKDLPGEVGYGLDVPFYASLPRLEARFFLDQYGGDDDVWIGKTLYRLLKVNCDDYLELAKLDYENCQSLHQLEWKSMQKWYRDCNLGEFGLSERSLLLAYYIAASTAFEPERSGERLTWATTAVLVETIASQRLSDEEKGEFVSEFEHGSNLKNQNGGSYTPSNRLVEILIDTVTPVGEGRGINQQLSNEWRKWLRTWKEGGDLGEAEARLLLHTIHLSSGLGESSFYHPQYHQLLDATSKVCHQLRIFQNRKVHAQGCTTHPVIGTTSQIEAGMQELVKLVFTKSSEDFPSLTKQSFFNIARSFYYTAYCHADAIDSHIDKVLFGRIV
nr:terpene synthase class II [Dracocephalum officinale]